MTITDVIIDAQAFATWYGFAAVVIGAVFAGGRAGRPRVLSVLVAGLLWPATGIKMFWPARS